MRGNRIARRVRFVVFGAVALAVFSAVVMVLWNWLMPPIFGLHSISYAQGFGLLALSKILFGGIRGGGGPGMHWRRRMAERWEKMTPQERERFQHGIAADAKV